MKKLLKIVGGLFAAFVIIIGGLIGWFKYEESKYAQTAVPYVKEAVSQFAQWDPESAKGLMSAEALKETSDEEFEKVITWLSKLGKMKTMGEPSLVNVYKGVSTENGSQKILTYTVDSVFDAGEALITIRLLDRGTDFKVFSFNVNSKALVDS